MAITLAWNVGDRKMGRQHPSRVDLRRLLDPWDKEELPWPRIYMLSAWALAIAIDVGMVASEVALIVLATLPNIMVSTYALRYVIATVAISIALNIWAFWPKDNDANVIGMGLAVVLGAGIPLGVYHLTRVAGRIRLAANNRLEASA